MSAPGPGESAADVEQLRAHPRDAEARLHTLMSAAEEAVRQSEASFRLLFENNPHPMWVYDLQTLAFLEVNDAAVVQYGWTREEFLGMRITDIRPPDDVGMLPDDIWHPQPSLQTSGVWRHRRKQGDVIDVEITSHTIAFAGRPAVLVDARDVTERRRLERRTHDSLEALLEIAGAIVGAPPGSQEPADDIREIARRVAALTRRVFGCARVSITSLDPATGAPRPLAAAGLTEHEAATWRAAAMGAFGPTAIDEATSRKLREGAVAVIDTRRLPPAEWASTLRVGTFLLAPMRVGEQIIGAIALDYGADDHTYTAAEIQLAGGVAKLAALALERERLLREREEARASARALEEASRRMDAFLGLAGHEMRTPLTSVGGNVQLAQRRLARLVASDQALADELGVLQRLLARSSAGLQRLNRLVNDVLDVARIQAGRLQVRLEPADLAEIVRDAVAEFRLAEPQRAVDVQLGDAVVPVLADAGRVGQVVTSLLTNAAKYSRADRPITVGMVVEQGEAMVWVRDEGIGIAEDDQRRIWERFARVEHAEQVHGSSVGLGLGLHISRTIVEEHGGAIAVESAPGRGSTFSFSLPLRR